MAVTKIKLAQTRVTEDFDFSGYNVVNLKAPVNANDAARKAYVDTEIAKVAGAMTYKGTWDASANSPAIPAASSANKGHYYVVSAAGTTTVDGTNDWEQRDWIVSNGSSWEKIDNTDKVVSVLGRTGVITAQNGDYNAGQVTFTAVGSVAATDVQSAIAEVDGDVTALAGRVTTAEGEIDTLQSDATALAGRVTTAEGEIDTLQSDATALAGRVTTAEGEIVTIKSDATALTGRVTAAETAATALAGRVTTAEGDIDALQADVATKLNKALAQGKIFVGNSSGDAVAASFIVRETPSANGSFDVYTLAATPVAGSEQVFLNGQLLDLTDDYTLSGSAITMNSAQSAADKVRVNYIALV